MKKLILINGIILVLVFLYWQVNGSMYNYIHFIPWQSLFSRLDYLVIFLISLFCFLGVLVLFVNRYKTLSNKDIIQVVNYEVLILLFIGLASTGFYIYRTNNPVVPLISVFHNNEPYIIMITWYYLEMLLFLAMIRLVWKKVKFYGIDSREK